MTLKNSQDAFGHALMDFHRGVGGHAVVERDDGYVDASENVGLYFTDYKKWPTRERKAMRLARGRILDVGCGAGRHALHLKGRGRDVVGIDRSPLAVRVCRERGLDHAKIASITRIPRGLGTFDTILMMGNNFGLFGNPRRARWLLRRFRGITGASGRIIAETLDPHATDNVFHLRYQKLNRRRGRMSGQIRIRLRYLSYIGSWFDYLFVSRREMLDIVRETGWRVVDFIDSGGPQYVAIIERV